MKRIGSLLMVVLLCICVLGGCQSDSSQQEHSFVQLTLEKGNVVIELYPEIAPKSVKLFLECVKSGYYDGKVFHRSLPGFIQGGSADGFGVGGYGKAVQGEFTENGFENNLKHERGVISLARTENPNSASGQFFIMTAAEPAFDGRYATFGKVVEGIEFVDEIEAMPTRGYANDELVTKPVIVKAEILKDYVPESSQKE